MLAYDLGEARRGTCQPRNVYQRSIMHNKFFVVDRRWVWTGSANLSDSGTGGYNANIVAVAA